MIEKHMLRLLNQERAEAGLRELEWDSKMATVARRYSEDMAEAGDLRHQLDGQKVGSRMRAAGYECRDSFREYGENIAKRPVVRRYKARNAGPWMAFVYDQSPEAMAEGLMGQWMDSSKGHRDAVLKREYRSVGVGVAVAMEYAANIRTSHPVVYATMNFTTCR